MDPFLPVDTTRDDACPTATLGRSDRDSVTAAFEAFPLSGRERLSAIAGVVAIAAARRHRTGAGEFLPRLLELARPDPDSAAPVLACSTLVPHRRRIAAAQAALEDALARLAVLLDEEGVGRREAAFVETVLLARLLGAHSPEAVRGALATVGRAIADPRFEPGEILIVPAADAHGAR